VIIVVISWLQIDQFDTPLRGIPGWTIS